MKITGKKLSMLLTAAVCIGVLILFHIVNLLMS